MGWLRLLAFEPRLVLLDIEDYLRSGALASGYGEALFEADGLPGTEAWVSVCDALGLWQIEGAHVRHAPDRGRAPASLRRALRPRPRCHLRAERLGQGVGDASTLGGNCGSGAALPVSQFLFGCAKIVGSEGWSCESFCPKDQRRSLNAASACS
jgi:hypothetical protein